MEDCRRQWREPGSLNTLLSPSDSTHHYVRESVFPILKAWLFAPTFTQTLWESGKNTETSLGKKAQMQSVEQLGGRGGLLVTQRSSTGHD